MAQEFIFHDEFSEWPNDWLQRKAREYTRAKYADLEEQAELFIRMGFAPEELTVVVPPWFEFTDCYVVPICPSAD